MQPSDPRLSLTVSVPDQTRTPATVGAVVAALVVPEPEGDQSESPSALVARTWTW